MAFVVLLSSFLSHGSVPIDTTKMKLFGHSIKNGHLVADTEIPLFAHTCTSPPCTITQIHCPTAGPANWFDAVVTLYIDDDPPMNFTLLELANVGNPTSLAPPGPPGPSPTPPPTPPAGPPRYQEYFLGLQGKNCHDTCAAQAGGLTCSSAVNTGFAIDKGVKMLARLATFNQSISTCIMGAVKHKPANEWWAPDQPQWTCGEDPNGNTGHCIGWDNIPLADLCTGSYPASCRVCHCTETTKSTPTSGYGGGPIVPGTGDGPAWGVGAFGHTAKNGGVYSTMRIPFGKSLRATLYSKSRGTFWFIIRGLESYPVVLGDLILPTAARLRLHRFENMTQTNELVTLADIGKGTAGAVLQLMFDASNPKSYGYLEACMRALVDGATEPIFLSSGAEDYFLSAYYFNEGEFKTPNSGLTYYDGKGTLSAYKTHFKDPVLFNDGLKLVFRNMETTTGCGDLEHCPNQYCAPNATAREGPNTWSAAREREQSGLRGGGNTDAMYKTLVWTYEWPAAAERQEREEKEKETAASPNTLMQVARFVAALGAENAFADTAAEAAVLAAAAQHGEAGRALRAVILGYATTTPSSEKDHKRIAAVLIALATQL